MSEETGRRRIRELVKRIDENPALLTMFRQARKRLPGDENYGDPLSLPPGVLGQQLALVAQERPSAL